MMRPGALVTFIFVSLLVTPGAFATLTDTFQNDANSGGDAGDSWAQATLVTSGAYGGQTFMVDDPADWYAFDLQGPSDAPVTEVHLAFAISSPTCVGLQIPLALQTVTIELLDPAGDSKANFTTGGCNASGRFDVEEGRTGENGTGPNGGIGKWSLAITIRGIGSSKLPADPTGILGHASVAQQAAPPRVGGHAPRGSSSPPNLEEDYALVLSCQPRC